MKRKVTRNGHPRGQNSQGRKLFRPRLSSSMTASFNAGRTLPRRSLRTMNETGTTTCRCWCQRTDVAVSLDQVFAGETASCGRRSCRPPQKACG